MRFISVHKKICFSSPEPQDGVHGEGPGEGRSGGGSEEMFLLQDGVRYSWSESCHGPRHFLYEWPHYHPDHAGWLMDKLLPHSKSHAKSDIHIIDFDVWSSRDSRGRLHSSHATILLLVIVGGLQSKVFHWCCWCSLLKKLSEHQYKLCAPL